MANYWLVPLSAERRPVRRVAQILVGNGLCTIPLALALDGVPGRGSSGRSATRCWPGVLEVGGFILFFRALERGDLAVVAPIIGLEGGIAALAVFAFGERVGALIGSGSRSRSWAAAWPPPQGGRRTAAGALPAAGAAVCLGLMFALYAAAEDLGPVSAVAAGRLSALDLLGASCSGAASAVPLRARRALLGAGRVDAAAFVAYSYAASRGPVSVAAVVAGQFSTLSAVVGIVLLRERLDRTSTSASRSPAPARRCSHLAQLTF